ncbi:MAG: hypothetical protein NTZ74_06595 [Chloroflexi bacterium]|nr:hypothetical protein [Chloroflexota bacterium]
MISLRAYHREIEKQIDEGRCEEAIAHCKYILVAFPKCIDTYRNLGKSLLECKRYQEALDIFLRVLTVFPDDFISHVALSIIYEDQRNLDLAILHMEQAFDLQPSNIAIQEELKRLFGRRDGSQPEKIRLTRGALIRMYARGELFQQAITESRVALEEDPNRIDYQVLLAKMYYSSNMFFDCIEICNHIIETCPYCFEANRLLDILFIKQRNSENGKKYHQRLVSLDPYYQFIETNPSNEIPDENNLIERLSYSPSSIPESPNLSWTKALGIKWEDDSAEENMEWLSSLNKDRNNLERTNLTPVSPESEKVMISIDEKTIPPNIESENDIPEWLLEAGWTPASGSILTNHDPLNNTLQEFTPLEESLDNELNFGFSNANNYLPIPLKTVIKPIEGLGDPSEESSMTNEIPPINDFRTPLKDWKEENIMDKNDLTAVSSSGDSNLPPDWLSQFSNSNLNNESSPIEGLPDWLKNFEQDQSNDGNRNGEVPDWLKTLQFDPEPDSVSAENKSSSLEDDSDIENQQIFTNFLPSQKLDPSSTSEHVLPPLMPSLPEGWKEETSVSPENEPDSMSKDTIPDWVRSILGPSEDIIEPEIIQKPLSEAVNPEKETKNNSLINLEPENNIVLGNTNQEKDFNQSNDEILEWLRDLKSENNDKEDQSLDQNLEDVRVNGSEISLDRLEDLSRNHLFSTEEEDQLPTVRADNGIQNSPSGDVPNNAKSILHPDIEEVKSLFSSLETINHSTILNSSEIDEPTKEELPVRENLQHTPFFENEIVGTNSPYGTIQKLMATKSFSQIPEMLFNVPENTKLIDSSISFLTSIASDNEFEFSYWQCIGDLYAYKNILNEAIFSYEKAEKILISKINS